MSWGFNTQQMIKRIQREPTVCPLSRDCDIGIRVLQPDGSYYSCGAFGDDRQYPISFSEELSLTEPLRPLLQHELHSMHDGCFTCPLFSICNGCKKTISDTKRLGLVEYHCKKMHENMNDILHIAKVEKGNIPTTYFSC